MVQAPDRLCLLRLSALGDVTHVVPVVRTRQQFRPQTELTWIIGRTEARLVGDLPGVEFIDFDKSSGLHAYRDLRAKLRGRRCGYARRRIGFDRARGRGRTSSTVSSSLSRHSASTSASCAGICPSPPTYRHSSCSS